MGRIAHPGIYTTQMTGKAGEYSVAAQCLLRGMSVHFPAVDTGADLIVGEKIRIQVKARRNKVRDGYTFFIGGSRPRNTQGVRDYTARDWQKSADFIVCWGIPENRYWIIPTADIAGHGIQILCLGFSPHWKFDCEEIKELHQGGMRGVDIARQIGCSDSTVSAVLNGRIKKPKPSFSNDSAKYEGAWQLIHDVIKPGDPDMSLDEEFSNLIKEQKEL